MDNIYNIIIRSHFQVNDLSDLFMRKKKKTTYLFYALKYLKKIIIQKFNNISFVS